MAGISEISHFVEFERSYNLVITDIPASVYDRKTQVWRFDFKSKIVWPLSLAQSALKVEKSWFFLSSWPWFSWIERLRALIPKGLLLLVFMRTIKWGHYVTRSCKSANSFVRKTKHLVPIGPLRVVSDFILIFIFRLCQSFPFNLFLK